MSVENAAAFEKKSPDETRVLTYGESGNGDGGASSSKRPKQTCREWFRKYFLQGQTLSNENEKLVDENLVSKFDEFVFLKHRKFFALLAPSLIAHLIWWIAAVKNDFFALYRTHWEMPVTMIFGAIVAGMTSEGGGAVAFPVMTFILKIAPNTARDFSIMIQSAGMSTALLVIAFMRVQVEWRAVIFASIGAIPGMIIGFHVLDPLLDASAKKMIFVSVWGSFAISLWILNRERKRVTFVVVPHFSTWRAAALSLSGFIGGIFTAFAGSGVDICVFSTLTLLFRVTEKTATPTTVTLMALMSQFGFYWRVVAMEGVPQLAWDYLKVCAPVVVTFAPLGSFIGSHFHRQSLAFLVYVLEAASFVGFLLTRPSLTLLAISLGILLGGYFFFRQMGAFGKMLLLLRNDQ